jgi:flavin-dependent dehydrogenase
MRRKGAVIVGGGPAGCAAAISLAKGGRETLLIERNAEPRDPVCGGFLGWDSLAALGRLGIDTQALGARPIRYLRLVSHDRSVEAKLPRSAAGLSRRTLDAAMLEAASDAGAELWLGRSVKAADVERLSIRLDDGEELSIDALLLATGKHELRGAARERDTSSDPVGIRTALAPSPELQRVLEGYIELHLFDGGYGGLLLQEDGSANLCLSVARERLRKAGGVTALLAELGGELPALRARLDHSEAQGWSAISGVPYGWRARSTSPGLYRLGDQAAVIASLAGDGIAIALESGCEAAAALIGGRSSGDFQRRFAARAAQPVAVAERLRWAAEHPFPRAPMMALLAVAPALSGIAARLTRIGG